MRSVKKCLIWDLDNTLWDGVLLEGSIRVREEAVTSITALDRRGILHSIASRGDEELAMTALREHRLDGFFLAPQVNWLPKSQSILAIAERLDIPLDALAFIDDDPFEREQITYMLPSVLVIASEEAAELPGRSEFSPIEITREAEHRRAFYQAEIQRDLARREFPTREEFLLSCKMQLTIRPMDGEDIPRVLELMTRTHQLNTTGIICDRASLLDLFRRRQNGLAVTVAELRDRFGWYGIIAAAIVQATESSWRLKFLAVSCRVMGRGIERALFASLVHGALDHGHRRPEAEFRDTGKNKMMRALYQMMGFTAHGGPDASGTLIFRARPAWLPDIPRWVEVV
jgi:FkbH-like protein